MAQVPKIPPARGNEHPETTRSGASDLAAVEVATCQQEQHRDPQAQAEVQRHMQPQHHGPRQATQNADSVHTLGVSSRSLFGEPLSQTQLDRLFSSEQRQVRKCTQSTCIRRRSVRISLRRLCHND